VQKDESGAQRTPFASLKFGRKTLATMDTRVAYQNIIKRVLQEHAEFRSRGDDPIKSYPVFDDQHGR
jgi:hypothetical protein